VTRKPLAPWETIPGLLPRLIELYTSPENYTAGEIGKMLTKEFDVLITRNSVIGKSHRLRMPVRVKPQPRGPKVKQHSPRSRVQQPKLFADAQPRDDDPITIYQLGYGDCRFPVGDYPHLYCGKASDEGRSYCGEHHALTHHPARKVWE